MSIYYSINDIDFYSPNINFIAKGKQALNSFTGTVLSLSVIGLFFMLSINYVLSQSNLGNAEKLTIKTNYGDMTNKFSLLYNLSGLKTLFKVFSLDNEEKDPIVILTTNLTEISKKINLEKIFTENYTYANGDIFILGVMLHNNTDNKIINLDLRENKFFQVKMYKEKYETVDKLKDPSHIHIDSDKDNTTTLLGLEAHDNFKFIKCQKLFENINKTTILNNNSSTAKLNTYLDFDSLINDYPFLNTFDCLDFSIEIPRPKNSNPDISKKIDYKISMQFELCNVFTENYTYSSASKGQNLPCLYLDYSKLSTKELNNINKMINEISITFFTLMRNYKNKNEINFIPDIKRVTLGYKNIISQLTQINIPLLANYFFDLPLDILATLDIPPYLSTIDLENSIYQQLGEADDSAVGELHITEANINIMANITSKTLTLPFLRFEIGVENKINLNFYFHRDYINIIGLIGNVTYGIFLVGKLIHYFLTSNKNLNWIMNEIMIIIDPKYNLTVQLEEHEIQNYKQKVIEEKVVFQKNEHFTFQELAGDRGLAVNHNRHISNGGMGLLIKNQDVLIKMYKYMNNIEKVKNFGKKKLNEKKKKNKIIRIENMIKENESLIFDQINRYNIREPFNFNVKDLVTPYYKEKLHVLKKAEEVLYMNTNFTTLILSVNSLKYILTKLILNEYQYVILRHLSTQAIVGEKVYGFKMDYFFSKFNEHEKWTYQNEKFRKALKSFRKNVKFCKYDDKILKLYQLLTQENIIENFMLQLKDYFKQTEQYRVKYGNLDLLANN